MKVGDIMKRYDADVWFVVTRLTNVSTAMPRGLGIVCVSAPGFLPAGHMTNITYTHTYIVPEDEIPDRVWSALAQLRMNGARHGQA